MAEKKTVEELRQTDILEVAQALGMDLKRSGRHYTWTEHDSLVITPGKNMFSWFSKDIAGGVFDLVRTVKEEQSGQAVSFKEAKHFLETGEFKIFEASTEPPKHFTYYLQRYENVGFQQANAYLMKERGLSQETIDFFRSKGVLVQANHKTGHVIEPVVVFKTLDQQGKVTGASLQGIQENKKLHDRGRLKRLMRGSDGLSGMHVDIGQPKRLVVAEAPIDLMSYYELHKNQLQDVRLLAMDGLKEGAISRHFMELLHLNRELEFNLDREVTPKALETIAKTTKFFDNPDNHQAITLAVDNDDAAHRFVSKLQNKGIAVQVDIPKISVVRQDKNDWNDFLKKESGTLLDTPGTHFYFLDQTEKPPANRYGGYYNQEVAETHLHVAQLHQVPAIVSSKVLQASDLPQATSEAWKAFITDHPELAPVKQENYHLRQARQKLARLESEFEETVSDVFTHARIRNGQPRMPWRQQEQTWMREDDRLNNKARRLRDELTAQQERVEILEEQEISKATGLNRQGRGLAMTVENIPNIKAELAKADRGESAYSAATIRKYRKDLARLEAMQEQVTAVTIQPGTQALIDQGLVNQWQKQPNLYFVKGLRRVALELTKDGVFRLGKSYLPQTDKEKTTVEDLLQRQFQGPRLAQGTEKGDTMPNKTTEKEASTRQVNEQGVLFQNLKEVTPELNQTSHPQLKVAFDFSENQHIAEAFSSGDIVPYQEFVDVLYQENVSQSFQTEYGYDKTFFDLQDEAGHTLVKDVRYDVGTEKETLSAQLINHLPEAYLRLAQHEDQVANHQFSPEQLEHITEFFKTRIPDVKKNYIYLPNGQEDMGYFLDGYLFAHQYAELAPLSPEKQVEALMSRLISEDGKFVDEVALGFDIKRLNEALLKEKFGYDPTVYLETYRLSEKNVDRIAEKDEKEFLASIDTTNFLKVVQLADQYGLSEVIFWRDYLPESLHQEFSTLNTSPIIEFIERYLDPSHDIAYGFEEELFNRIHQKGTLKPKIAEKLPELADQLEAMNQAQEKALESSQELSAESNFGDFPDVQEAAPLPEAEQPQPLEGLSPDQPPSQPLLHFSTKADPKSSPHKKNYHTVTAKELRKLNRYAPTIQESAKWYLDNLADSQVTYFYQDGNEVKSISINYLKENFMHLTGLAPTGPGQTPEKTLVDLAQGKGDFDHLLIANKGATFDKLKVLPELQAITEAESFFFGDLSSVERLHSLELDKAIRSSDKDLLLAVRSVDDGEGPKHFPASFLRLKEQLNIALDASQSEKTILGVFRTRNGQVDTLSVNQDYIKDKGQAMKAMVENGRLEPVEVGIKALKAKVVSIERPQEIIYQAGDMVAYEAFATEFHRLNNELYPEHQAIWEATGRISPHLPYQTVVIDLLDGEGKVVQSDIHLTIGQEKDGIAAHLEAAIDPELKAAIEEMDLALTPVDQKAPKKASVFDNLRDRTTRFFQSIRQSTQDKDTDQPHVETNPSTDVPMEEVQQPVSSEATTDKTKASEEVVSEEKEATITEAVTTTEDKQAVTPQQEEPMPEKERRTVAQIIADRDTKALSQHMKEGVKDYFASDKYKAYLDTVAKLPHYSPRNIQMLMAQRSDLTAVASANSWRKDFGRLINKGEKALWIWAPKQVLRRDKETGEPVLNADGKQVYDTRFNLVPVFDVSQTNGKDLGLGIKILEGDHKGYATLYQATKSVAEELGVQVEISQDLPTGAEGVYRRDEAKIVLKAGRSEQATLHAFFHELAHAQLDHGGNQQKELTVSTEELQAESLAYVVSSHFGIDTSEQSFDYLASWSQDKEGLKDLEAQLKIVQKEASELIQKLDQSFEKYQAKDLSKTNAFTEKLERFKEQSKEKLQEKQKGEKDTSKKDLGSHQLSPNLP